MHVDVGVGGLVEAVLPLCLLLQDTECSHASAGLEKRFFYRNQGTEHPGPLPDINNASHAINDDGVLSCADLQQAMYGI